MSVETKFAEFSTGQKSIAIALLIFVVPAVLTFVFACNVGIGWLLLWAIITVFGPIVPYTWTVTIAFAVFVGVGRYVLSAARTKSHKSS